MDKSIAEIKAILRGYNKQYHHFKKNEANSARKNWMHKCAKAKSKVNKTKIASEIKQIINTEASRQAWRRV